MTDFDLNALIDHALSGKEPDPHVIARRLMPKVPRAERDALLASLLVERVTLRLRFARSARLASELDRGDSTSDARRHDAPASLAADHSSPDTHSAAVGGTSRWQKHFKSIRDRHRVAEGWKFTDDLTAEECDEVARSYEQRAQANQTQANYFHTLAHYIRETGVSTVGELRVREERAA